MKKIALLVAMMALVVAGLSFAQAKADFSGTWAPKVDAAAPPSGGRGGMAGPMTVKQTAAELEVTRGQNASTYKLDGTESVSKTARGESKSTVTFDGAKLVIKTAMEGPNGTMETTATWSLSADGKELTIVNATQRGERTMVYTKQ
jgi:hypothetical protein